MKATIEFNLPEEDQDAQLALNGWKIAVAVNDALNKIRHKLKHEDLDEQYTAGLEKARELILESLEDREIQELVLH